MNRNKKQITAYYNQSIANVVNADVLHPPAWSAFLLSLDFSLVSVLLEKTFLLVWCGADHQAKFELCSENHVPCSTVKPLKSADI